MPLQVQQPIIYLITSGATTIETTPASKEFASVLKLVAAAVAANVSLFQIREKNLKARVLEELTVKASEVTRPSRTRLLVNDRADIARAAGADGVHLTTQSLPTAVVRRTFGSGFLIGVSTHSVEDARAARDADADFAVWGPVFATASKRSYGKPFGTTELAAVAKDVAPFPILALGGVTIDDAKDCFAAGAGGIAGIRVFEGDDLAQTVDRIRQSFDIPR